MFFYISAFNSMMAVPTIFKHAVLCVSVHIEQEKERKRVKPSY